MQKWVAVPWDTYEKLTKDSSEIDSEDQSGTGTSALSVETIVAAVPKNNRRDATTILHHLERDPNITWSHKGELIVKGETKHNTHLVDLLKDAFYKFKHWEPEGVHDFYRALAESNLPVGTIKNLDRRALLESYKQPKPPGVLASAWLTWK